MYVVEKEQEQLKKVKSSCSKAEKVRIRVPYYNMKAASTPPKKDHSYIPHAITFLSGASYGLNTVIVGQPLDTIKSRMQGIAVSKTPNSINNKNVSASATSIFKDLYRKEGIRGLYRGGLPLMIGGSMMRSAQFGVRYVILKRIQI
jgi:hypothetical protein